MPYITEGRRRLYKKPLDELIEILDTETDHGCQFSGDVVYVIYKILKSLYSDGRFEERVNALKVLESAKLEYYRRIVAPYEDQKIEDNGDV